MRTASCVLVVYVVLVIAGALWPPAGLLGDARPELAAIAATYLGLTARRSIAGAVAASVVVGYLGDLLGGAPLGQGALVGGAVCLLGNLVHRRLLVRGLGMTVGFSLFVGLVAALLALVVRAVTQQPLAAGGLELARLLGAGAATAVVGPVVLRLLRRVDAAFARTHRERDAALEGLVP